MMSGRDAALGSTLVVKLSCVSYALVIPAKAGIHRTFQQSKFLDTGFRRCDGGIEDNVAGASRAQTSSGTEPPSPRARHQVVYGVPFDFSAAELGVRWLVVGFWRSTVLLMGSSFAQRCQPWSSESRNRHPGRSTCHSPSSISMGKMSPFIKRRRETRLESSVTPKGRKAKACSSST